MDSSEQTLESAASGWYIVYDWCGHSAPNMDRLRSPQASTHIESTETVDTRATNCSRCPQTSPHTHANAACPRYTCRRIELPCTRPDCFIRRGHIGPHQTWSPCSVESCTSFQGHDGPHKAALPTIAGLTSSRELTAAREIENRNNAAQILRQLESMILSALAGIESLSIQAQNFDDDGTGGSPANSATLSTPYGTDDHATRRGRSTRSYNAGPDPGSEESLRPFWEDHRPSHFFNPSCTLFRLAPDAEKPLTLPGGLLARLEASLWPERPSGSEIQRGLSVERYIVPDPPVFPSFEPIEATSDRFASYRRGESLFADELLASERETRRVTIERRPLPYGSSVPFEPWEFEDEDAGSNDGIANIGDPDDIEVIDDTDLSDRERTHASVAAFRASYARLSGIVTTENSMSDALLGSSTELSPVLSVPSDGEFAPCDTGWNIAPGVTDTKGHIFEPTNETNSSAGIQSWQKDYSCWSDPESDTGPMDSMVYPKLGDASGDLDAIDSVDTETPTSPYVGLEASSRQVRLFMLRPSAGQSDPIVGSFQLVSLSKASSYIALSYRWGNNMNTRDIEVDGWTLSIRENLWSFLQVQRQNISETKAFWIDALCINQEDVHERNHQVGLMKHIYNSASEVYIWLGDDADDSRLAMDFVNKRGGKPLQPKGLGYKPIWTEREGRAVFQLCDRPYWRRMWIIQEIIHAERLTVWCGQQSFPWTMLERLYSTLKTLERGNWFVHHKYVIDVVQSSAGVMVWQRAHWRHPQTPQPKLSMLIEVFRDWQCTDIRDKVYALVGMASLPSAVIPDYSSSTLEVYLNVCKKALDAGPRFPDLLSQVLGLSDRDVDLLDRDLLEYKRHPPDRLVLRARMENAGFENCMLDDDRND